MTVCNSIYRPVMAKVGFQSQKIGSRTYSTAQHTLQSLQSMQSTLKREKPDTEIDMMKNVKELEKFINGENPEKTITIGNQKESFEDGKALYNRLKERGNSYFEIEAITSVFSHIGCDAQSFLNKSIYINDNINRNTKERITKLHDIQESLYGSMRDEINAAKNSKIQSKKTHRR